jgi:hypothetical protein
MYPNGIGKSKPTAPPSDLNADVETGHRSTTMGNLANISLATHSLLEWDAEREVITNNPQANDLLHYEYREPWKLN